MYVVEKIFIKISGISLRGSHFLHEILAARVYLRFWYSILSGEGCFSELAVVNKEYSCVIQRPQLYKWLTVDVLLLPLCPIILNALADNHCCIV